MSRIAGRFAQVEPRRRVRDLVLGLLSDLPHKNCWSIAEWAGEATPGGMQHLLGRAEWDADRVRADVREYVLEHLHDEDAVLVVDETGDVKKGTHTVGVQRQYTGTAGRIENAQVAVVRADEHVHNPAPESLVPLSCDEIQRLFITLIVRPVHDAAHRLRWSDWRRVHQVRSRTSHYRRQAASPT
ncbi:MULTISPECIES: transposase [Kitasatospora]|nr:MULTISPECIES: transposase [Kitasatospora]